MSLHCPKHFQRLFLSFHIKSQFLCQFSTFRVTCKCCFSLPTCTSSLTTHTQLTLIRQAVSLSQSRFVHNLCILSLECSPYPSFNSIHPSRPGLNLSSSKMPLLTTSSLADLPDFEIQIVLTIFVVQLNPDRCLI